MFPAFPSALRTIWYAYTSDLIADREKLLCDLKEAKDKRSQLTIVAPCDGVINNLSLEEKNAVKEDQLLCKVMQSERFKVVINVDELDIPSVSIGQGAAVKVTAFNYESFDTSVTRISAIGTSVNGMTNYPTSLLLSDSTGIYSGMSTNADILVESRKDTLIIPIRALKVDGNKTYVTRIDNKDAKNPSRQDVTVEVGVVSGTKAEILSGLNEGDRVEVVGKSSSDIMNAMIETQASMQDAILGK